jgi:hypothetical protein
VLCATFRGQASLAETLCIGRYLTCVLLIVVDRLDSRAQIPRYSFWNIWQRTGGASTSFPLTVVPDEVQIAAMGSDNGTCSFDPAVRHDGPFPEKGMAGINESSVLVIPSNWAPRYHRVKLKEICGRASAQAASRICALVVRQKTSASQLR